MEDLAPHKYITVQGKNPTKRELVSWDEKHWMHFIQFLKFFIVKDEDGNSKFKVSKSRWLEAEGFLEMPNHPFQEFMYRINRFSFDAGMNEKKFYFKLASMIKQTLQYIRENPSIVSPKMREAIEPEPRLAWCLKQTTIRNTAVGQVLAPNAVRDIGFLGDNSPAVAHEQRLMEAAIKVTNLLTKMVDSVNAREDELKKMPLREVLSAIGRMSYVFSVGRQLKVSKGVFKQINIHAAGREELEAAVLAVNKD